MQLLKNEAPLKDGVKTNGKKRSEMIRSKVSEINGCIEPVQCYYEYKEAQIRLLLIPPAALEASPIVK